MSQTDVDAFALAFITEHTRLEVDGKAHRALVSGIKDLLQAERAAIAAALQVRADRMPRQMAERVFLEDMIRKYVLVQP